MKCALCDHRGSFPEVGRTRGDDRRVYRCPRCKYDQAKNLFGTGQFLARPLDLHVPAETSPIKLAYEQHLGQAGVMSPDDVTRPNESTTDEQLAAGFLADLAETTPGIEPWLAETMRQVAEGPSSLSRQDDPTTVTPWHRLTQAEKKEHQQRVINALDDVLEHAMEIVGVDAHEMSETSKRVFIDISRLLLKNAMLAYETVRECGADSEEMAFGQVLAGFRPTFDNVVEARNALPATVDRPTVEDDPFLRLLTSFSVPVQQAVDPHLREDIFDTILRRTWMDAPES